MPTTPQTLMKRHFISIPLPRSLHCNSIVIARFYFSYHCYVLCAVKNFFLLMIKLISPLRLLRQDLEKLHIFFSLLLLLRSLQRDSNKKNIILTFTTFIFLLNPRYYLRHVTIKRILYFHFFATFTTS